MKKELFRNFESSRLVYAGPEAAPDTSAQETDAKLKAKLEGMDIGDVLEKHMDEVWAQYTDAGAEEILRSRWDKSRYDHPSRSITDSSSPRSEWALRKSRRMDPSLSGS